MIGFPEKSNPPIFIYIYIYRCQIDIIDGTCTSKKRGGGGGEGSFLGTEEGIQNDPVSPGSANESVALRTVFLSFLSLLASRLGSSLLPRNARDARGNVSRGHARVIVIINFEVALKSAATN